MALRDDAKAVLAELQQRGRLRTPRTFAGSMQQVLELDGRKVHNFSSNDYLGLAGDKRLVSELASAAGTDGVGAGASRLIVGPRRVSELEAGLAAWLRVEQVQLFNSGYAANVGVLSTVAGPDTTVFSDELNHASIIDGCRLSRAKVVVYRHADLSDLREKLRTDTSRRRLVVSESVFSMDGDVADVAALHELAREYDSSLMLDEAHAVGVLGPQGRGVAAERGVSPDILVGTLGKAFGCYGAFVAADALVIRWLWNRARSLVYSTGLPPALAGAALQALEIIAGAEGETLRRRVHDNGQKLASALGLRVTSHIVPWLVGEDAAAVALSGELLQEGLFIQAIRPPTVPEGSARLRIALGTHEADALDELIAALGRRSQR